MKKIKLDAKRLHIKKEKIANLTSDDMSHIAGGDADSTIGGTMNCPSRACSALNKCKNPPPESDICPTQSTTPACPLTW